MSLRELIAYIRCNLDAEPEEIEYAYGSFACPRCESNRSLTEELQDLRERIKEYEEIIKYLNSLVYQESEDPINIIEDEDNPT